MEKRCLGGIDSFVKMDQIRSVTRHYLERKVGEILPEDMIRLDLRLIASLNLQGTVNKLIEAALAEKFGADEEAN